jgi:SAM-dependent methyltransferase
VEQAVSDMNRSFSGSMPEFYDRFLVPLIFEPFARRMAERLAGMTTPGHVLEVAAGTGVVTRAMVQTLPDTVGITATDLNPAMLDRARSYRGMDRVVWQEADALSLPFSDKQFDYVICQFGVMFFPDKMAAFSEARRVLRPGGQFLFSVWGDQQRSLVGVASDVVGKVLCREPASMVAPPYNDGAAVRSDLAAAGLSSVTEEVLLERSRTSSARQAAIATCHGGLLRSHIDAAAPHRLDEITDITTEAIASRFGDGPIDAPLHAILFTATRPVEPT